MTLLSISRERDVRYLRLTIVLIPNPIFMKDLQKNVLDYHKIIKDSTARVEKLTAEKQDVSSHEIP